MQREPIPFITAPGVFLTLFIYAIIISVTGKIPSIYEDQNLYLTLGVIAVALGPLFNVLFHAIWKTKLFNGYQSFGYQKEYLNKHIDRLKIAKAFDLAIHNCPEGHYKELYDYCCRRGSAYISNIFALFSIIIGYLIYILFVYILYNKSNYTTTITIIMTIFLISTNFVIIIFLQWLDKQIYFLEKLLIRKRGGQKYLNELLEGNDL